LGGWFYLLLIGAMVVVGVVAAYFGWRSERPVEPRRVVVPGPLANNKGRIVGLALLALLVFGYFVEKSSDSKTTSTGSQQPTETYRTTAADLFDRYAKNEVETDMALKGKIVEISGTVESIRKDFLDNLRVDLETPNQFMPASMQVIPEQEGRLADLRKGQRVTLRCPKMIRWGGTPNGSKCILQ
jgi:hypothetical protein